MYLGRYIVLGLVLLILALTLMDFRLDNLKKVNANQREVFAGTLQFEMFYGAPGFGEDTTQDEKEPTYILHVNEPFLFRDTSFTSDASYDTVNTIHIRFDPASAVNGTNLKKIIGEKIIVECTLYPAHTGHHHAPAVTEKVFAITKQ